MSTFCTTAKWGPPYGSSSTGSGPSGSAPPGVKSAIRRSRAPPTKNVGVAKSTGVSEVDAIVPTRSPSTSTSVVGRPVIVAEVEHGDVRADHGRVDTRLLGETGQRARARRRATRASRSGPRSRGRPRRRRHRGPAPPAGRPASPARRRTSAACVSSPSSGADQAAVGEPRGDPDGDVEPPVVVVLADEVGLPRVRIDPQDLHRALIARLHQQRSTGRARSTRRSRGRGTRRDPTRRRRVRRRGRRSRA